LYKETETAWPWHNVKKYFILGVKLYPALPDMMHVIMYVLAAETNERVC
jgi:hypothetical protein